MQHNFTILSLCQRLITEEAKLRFYIPPKISKFPSNQLYLKTFQLLFFIHLLKRLIRQPRVSSVLKLVLLGTLSTERICDADGRPEVQVCIINLWLPLVTILASRLVDVPDDKLRQVPFRRNDSLFLDSKFS